MENDLLALKMYHNQIVDTSLLYPHPNGPPAKQALRLVTPYIGTTSVWINSTIDIWYNDICNEAFKPLPVVTIAEKTPKQPWS